MALKDTQAARRKKRLINNKRKLNLSSSKWSKPGIVKVLKISNKQQCNDSKIS